MQIRAVVAVVVMVMVVMATVVMTPHYQEPCRLWPQVVAAAVDIAACVLACRRSAATGRPPAGCGVGSA